ncbi:unnamed protein product [Caenorhabditis bovis]|uniref:K Homology domain-containing protein n=1 Tax=Caenorhabditis bovis TaxID=2654633 RepID=A0A8S1FE91_9PELO|nr:unnamed protein product [Caenorhabditis bovis]
MDLSEEMNANSRRSQHGVDPTAGHLQMPGAWYYEEELTGSPINDADDAAMLRTFQTSAAGGVRNVTHAVTVPSSEHVAEIVGRQGCKIKALRAKTNTYIKTPIRGDPSVFVVTGRPEDVMEAKREIECAAEHFTHIRTSRRHSQGGTHVAGHVTIYVRVPLRVVGLVVGPKGATIKRIQQETHTYIITPSREREPVFEVTGMKANVEQARKEIEDHIFQRTGNMPITDSNLIPAMNMDNHMCHNMAMGYNPPYNQENRSNDFDMRQLADSNMGLSSLLRSFPSMRSAYSSDVFANEFGSHRHSLGATSPLHASNFFNMPPRQSRYCADSTRNSLGNLLDGDIFGKSVESFGNSSLWSSTMGLNSEDTMRHTTSPTSSLVSLNPISSSFGGILQSIWSDIPSSSRCSLPSTATPSSAEVSPVDSLAASPKSTCDDEKTLVENPASLIA